MTEHKFTEEDVIKALERCSSAECERCAWEPSEDCYKGSLGCNDDLMRSALGLINRQKAHIAFWMDAAANAKKEAISEFAEKLKNYAEVVTTLSDDETILAIQDHFVDEVAEEMIGGQNG